MNRRLSGGAAPLVVALLGILLCACQAAIGSGLSEEQANRVVVALDEHGIPSTKEAEAGGGEGATFRVMVSPDDVAAALTVLRASDLPHPEPSGLAEVFGEGSLVPTATEERARYTAALGGEIARSLESIDGVVSARVHVALPDASSLPLDAPPPSPRASVLVRHRAGALAADQDAIRRLVAGAVHGLAVEDVAVVALPVPDATASARELSHVGLIAVARSSSFTLKAVLGGMLLVNVLLAAALVVVLMRRRSAPSPGEGEGGDAAKS